MTFLIMFNFTLFLTIIILSIVEWKRIYTSTIYDASVREYRNSKMRDGRWKFYKRDIM